MDDNVKQVKSIEERVNATLDKIRPYIQRLSFKPKSEVINVSNGKVMMFDGSMEHKPCKSSGFGCRDIIVVFFHKK